VFAVFAVFRTKHFSRRRDDLDLVSLHDRGVLGTTLREALLAADAPAGNRRTRRLVSGCWLGYARPIMEWPVTAPLATKHAPTRR
jgi:hypothetical protein